MPSHLSLLPGRSSVLPGIYSSIVEPRGAAKGSECVWELQEQWEGESTLAMDRETMVPAGKLDFPLHFGMAWPCRVLELATCFWAHTWHSDSLVSWLCLYNLGAVPLPRDFYMYHFRLQVIIQSVACCTMGKLIPFPVPLHMPQFLWRLCPLGIWLCLLEIACSWLLGRRYAGERWWISLPCFIDCWEKG